MCVVFVDFAGTYFPVIYFAKHIRTRRCWSFKTIYARKHIIVSGLSGTFWAIWCAQNYAYGYTGLQSSGIYAPLLLVGKANTLNSLAFYGRTINVLQKNLLRKPVLPHIPIFPQKWCCVGACVALCCFTYHYKFIIIFMNGNMLLRTLERSCHGYSLLKFFARLVASALVYVCGFFSEWLLT